MTGGTAIHRGDNTFLAHFKPLLFSGLVCASAFFGKTAILQLNVVIMVEFVFSAI